MVWCKNHTFDCTSLALSLINAWVFNTNKYPTKNKELSNVEKGEGEAYFENGQKEGEKNDELVDFYNVVVNEVSRCLALFHTPYYMEPSQLSPCSFPSKENVKEIQYCSSKSSLLQQSCLFFCYIRGVYSPIYRVSHTSGPQDCSLKSPFQ